MSLYVGHTGGTEVGHTGGTLRYARVPLDVGTDPRLKALDVRVYIILAASVWQGSTTSVGIRYLAEMSCCAKRLAMASLKRLIAAGHVERTVSGRGKRAMYVLTSPVFGQKQGNVDVVVSAPRGKRLVGVAKGA